MSVIQIIYRGGRKFCLPIKSREKYLAIRGTKRQKENFEKARQGEQSSKMNLVQFNYTLLPPQTEIPLRGYHLLSDTFAHDIDCYDEKESNAIAEKVLAMKEEISLLMLERTAHYGLHIVCKRKKGVTILESQVALATLLKTEMDTNAKDIQRVWFASTDSPEELLFLDDALFECHLTEEEAEAEYTELRQKTARGLEDVPEGARKADKHYRPWEDHSAPQKKEESKPMSTEAYLGVPYAKIIDKWWEMYNDGCTPVKSNRDVLTYELAVNLRHICGFDESLLMSVIPCYDGFSNEEKLKCIKSALNTTRTQMPKRLRDVLAELKKDNTNDAKLYDAIEDIEEEDAKYYYNRIPKDALPLGVRDSLDGVGEKMAMPMLACVTSMIGALATNVKVNIHGNPVNLNIHSFIVGEAGSGKGSLDNLVSSWMTEEIAKNATYFEEEQKYREAKRAAKNKDEQPKEKKYPVRYLTMNNTIANLAERLANTEGKHAFSFTPEADTVASKWKSSMSDFSTMLRQAYDGTRYEREAKSADATSVHIDRLLWNVCMCGTPDALYRVISNYTDGLLSRFVIAHTPDNTYTALDDTPFRLSSENIANITRVAHILPYMKGTLELPLLEERSRQWVEDVRKRALQNDDRAMARARIRDHISAYRMTVAVLLCKVAEKLIDVYGDEEAINVLASQDALQTWTNDLLDENLLTLYDVMADSVIDNDMLYFRDKMENATEVVVKKKKTKAMSFFEQLPNNFRLSDVIVLRGGNSNKARIMVFKWKQEGLIKKLENDTFVKL